jgi:hypothetical protein
MAQRRMLIALYCGLSVAAALAMLLATEIKSQEAQQSATPLKDVCPDGWDRYSCQGVRLCVSPDVASRYDNRLGCTGPEKAIVPAQWSHATPEEVGYADMSFSAGGYNYVSSVMRFDSSMIKNGDVKEAMNQLSRSIITKSDPHRYSDGEQEANKPLELRSLDTYGLRPPPPKTPVTEVCPTGWRRFSCQFVRLCVAPNVTNRYNLSKSEKFGYAKCEIDNHAVGGEDTHSSPHDVGAAAGWMLLGPRYVGVVKLDSSDILDGNLDEAIQRLVLVPLPTNALMEYERGARDGLARFENYLNENRIKEKEIEDGKRPH